MPNVLAILVILLGGLFVTVGLSGNYTEPFALVGITLPGTEQEQLGGVKTGTASTSSTTPASGSNLPTGGNVLAGIGNQHITGV